MAYNYISSHTDFSAVICVPVEILTAEVSMTAKQIYIYLLNRSKQNKFVDKLILEIQTRVFDSFKIQCYMI